MMVNTTTGGKNTGGSRATRNTTMYGSALPWRTFLYFTLSSSPTLRVYGHSIMEMRGTVLVPNAGPSWEHLSPKRKITIRPVERQNGGILPLQTYRSLGKSNQHCKLHRLNAEEQKFGTESEVRTYLAMVALDPARFNISHSSRSMLWKLDTLSPTQCQQLIQKIQKEQKASQPVPPEALEIIYCDAHICVTNKPSGVLSVPGPRQNPSLANVVYDILQPDIDVDQMVVHRLDMATSGILVYALSLKALSKLHLDFRQRRVQKTYQALVAHHSHDEQSTFGGALEGEINIDLERDPDNPPFMRIAQPRPAPIGDEEPADPILGPVGSSHKFYRQAPKECLTTWTLIRREVYQGMTVSRLDLRPWTGRTHQLRVHCAQGLGSPIVGDDIYGTENPASQPASQLCLHARQLCLHHPITGAPMIFEADPPF
jgi:tRNA pseudouridine32 synthase / 23S rRNA pseudouridine746 synthase